MNRSGPADGSKLSSVTVGVPADGNRNGPTLYSAVVADVLDARGYRHQAMDPRIVPLELDMTLLGRAVPVLAGDATELEPAEPYRQELEAVDALSKGDVLVAAVEAQTISGFWGELLSTAARSKGAVGAVLDGYTRDAAAIGAQGFPVFARGCSPLDSKGRNEVLRIGQPVVCGGVRVAQGDYVIADRDGVVAIPGDIVDDVVSEALDKVGHESEMRRALAGGMGVMAAYDRYGVL